MSLTGVKFRAYPSKEQKKLLSQWMGCARFIWNAKCDEQEYFYKFKTKFCPINMYPPIDQAYAQFKSKETSPWLFDCPSILLRNTAYTWKNTFSDFLKGSCGKPQKKRKGSAESIWLTSEIFIFDGNKLSIGSQKHSLGELKFKDHRAFKKPKSIRIKKEAGKYYVSFCYDSGLASELITQKEHLQHLNGASRAELEQSVVGIDRGVKIAVQAGEQIFNPPKVHELRKNCLSKNIKRLQKCLSRQQKGSNQRQKTKERIKKSHESIANMRREFAHQTSHKLVNSNAKVLVFEDLKTKQMTKKAKPKQAQNGKYIKNNKKAKSGLNLAILDQTWAMLYMFCFYKAQKYVKAIFKISASFTSQECADCGHIHPENRQTQSEFRCISCGHTDNADRNASLVIKKRAINLILDSGTELSASGLLTPGRHGALSQRKTHKANALWAIGDDVSKMINQAATAV